MDEGRRFADLRLLAMDMDSTLITIECIDELGDLAGKKAEIAEITGQAMRGEIEYRESLRRRVKSLAGLPESSLQEIYDQRLKLTPGAEVLVSACQRHGVQLLLVSGGFTFFTERLKQRLGLHHTISNVLEVKDGKLTGALVGEIVDADAKAAKFRAVLKSLKAAKRPERRDRRRRQRPEDDGRGRAVGRLPRQARGARRGELRAQLERPRRRGEPVRVA